MIGGPAVKDKVFYFGSYERRRERSSTVVTSPAAFGLVVPTPADEHQGHVRADVRFDNKNSLAVRYNMVRWRQDNESGGLQLPGTGYIWDNNVDTLHGTFTTIVSNRVLNEVRGQFSRYYDLRAAKCDCVQFNRSGYSVTGGVSTGTWGVIPEDTYDVSDTLSLWRGAHSIKLALTRTKRRKALVPSRSSARRSPTFCTKTASSRWLGDSPTARRRAGSSASTISRRSTSAAHAILTGRDSRRSDGSFAEWT